MKETMLVIDLQAEVSKADRVAGEGGKGGLVLVVRGALLGRGFLVQL